MRNRDLHLTRHSGNRRNITLMLQRIRREIAYIDASLHQAQTRNADTCYEASLIDAKAELRRADLNLVYCLEHL